MNELATDIIDALRKVIDMADDAMCEEAILLGHDDAENESREQALDTVKKWFADQKADSVEPRFRFEAHIPHGSGDAELRIIDGASDNDVLAVIDPDLIWSRNTQYGLAELFAKALNAAGFQPNLQEEEEDS